MPLSCEMGIRGACLTPVREGVVDHRDTVQSDTEKSAANQQIALCCSRARSSRIVIDLWREPARASRSRLERRPHWRGVQLETERRAAIVALDQLDDAAMQLQHPLHDQQSQTALAAYVA